MRKLFIICGLALWGWTAQAQSLKAYEKAGDAAMEQHEYYNAMHYYGEVLKSKNIPGLYYKYAEACRLSYDYQKAEEAYSEVFRSPERSVFPLLGFHYATVLKHNGKYDAAATEFNRFAQGYPRDDFYRKKALQENKACYIAKELVKKPIDTIAVERLGDHINTEFSDFGAHLVDFKLQYSSLRFAFKPDKAQRKNKKLEDANKRLVSKLLLADDFGKEKGELVPVLNQENQHTANSALSMDGKRLYFTYCTGERSDSIECAIYVCRRQEDGSWSSPRRLPDPINLKGTTSTQPNLAWDSLKKKEILFFASNRAGGQGDLDIWYVSISKDSIYGDVINMGTPINTIDAEGTPFFDTKTQTFYFSSRWHSGLGGFDVFKTQRLEMVWQEPVNVGVPINSAANDLYFVLNDNDTTGFFASNRTGSTAIVGESCCNDIYAFSAQRRKVPTTVIDTPPVDTIPLIVSTDPPQTDPSNPGTSITKTGNGGDGGKGGKTDPFDPGKGLTTTSTTTTTTTTTTRKTETEITVMLTELNKMLPLRLYFHNDEPDSNTTSTHTDKPYELPYRHYVSLQEQYIDMHSAQFDVERQPEVQVQVRDFFEGEVKGEYNRMNAFFDKLLELLEAGVKLEIYIKGYTSPRSSEGYNAALAQRRITSVRKQLFIYKKGIFMQHFQNKNFWVHEVPLGESTTPKGISDEIEDPANSIYSVEASRERRAEIIVLQRMK